MLEKILGVAASVLIALVIFVQVFRLPGVDIFLASFFAVALLLSMYYVKETGASIYTFVMLIYAVSFVSHIAYILGFKTYLLAVNLSLAAHLLFAILLFWTSRLLHKKIGGDSFYVSVTAIVLLAHVIVLLVGDEYWKAFGTNLYYVLLGLVATVKIKIEIDKALIPAEQKILNIVLLVIAYPISGLVVSTIRNF